LKNASTIFLLVLLGCGDKLPKTKQIVPASKSTLSLFISPPDKDNFAITIDDSLTFDKYVVDESEHGPQELITTINKFENRFKIKLRIRDRDTTFMLDTRKIDSLIFGLNQDNRFVIFDQDEYIWAYDD